MSVLKIFESLAVYLQRYISNVFASVSPAFLCLSCFNLAIQYFQIQIISN